jgi:hypothetical protein
MTKIFFATRAAVWLALTMLSVSLLAQGAKPNTTPSIPVALPQYASITSTDNTIQISRLPIIDNGNLAYVDVTLAVTFGVDDNGQITVNFVPPTVVTSPTLLVNNFKAGTYVGPADVNGDKNIIVVAGPSPLAGGGSGWTLTTTSDSSPSTYPSTAVWYAEPLASNPLYSRITAAQITAQTASAYSFGEGDSGSDPNNDWPNNSLLGFNQVGNTLIVSSFTNNYCCGSTDHPTPVDTITYTLQP